MRRSELRARILHGLNEDPDEPVFWEEDELNEMIDEAAEILAEESGAIKRTAFLALKGYRTYYSVRAVAPDILAPYRVWHHDNSRRLDAVTISGLDNRHETWSSVTGYPECWFPLSFDVFGIWPTPGSSGGVLRFDYLAWPRALMDDDDEPEFPEGDHEALVLYGVYDGLMKRWGEEKAGLDVYARFLQQWGDSRARTGVRRMQSRIRTRGEAVTGTTTMTGLP